jgi:C4-dicarboxylate-specific signal transduction histidine kinase
MVLDLPVLPAVYGDEAALERVFVNLLRNAVEALAEVPDPVVRVTAAVLHDEMQRTHVEVRVRDNGPGIPPADRVRVFEPFFTTKPAGAGLGLGLAIVRQTVEACAGAIDVAPGPTPGTEFVIRLRVAP